MIQKAAGFEWPDVAKETYKDEPGTWLAVTRRGLMMDNGTGFEVRYFEIDTGGYTSFEKHRHEHCVLVLRGRGQVRLDAAWHDLEPNDTVHVKSWQPHQFRNAGDEPFGILCIVDKDRDRPVLLDTQGDPRTSE